MSLHNLKNALIGAATLCVLSAAPAFAQQPARVGALECNVAGGVGLIITSSKALDCYFFRDTGDAVEHYVGTIRRIGVAIGATGPGTLDWIVFAPTTSPGAGALSGEYGGVGASASAAIGVGANALVGGSNRTISLQPFSVQAQVGVDVAAGVTDVVLEYVPPVQPAKPHPRRHKK